MTKPKETVKHRLNKQHAYFEALGRFVQEFSRTENAVLMTLVALTGTTRPIGRAIFSGVRIETAMSFINRILEVTDADQSTKDVFQYAFTQLGHINQARNLILHYGVPLGIISDRRGNIIEAPDMVVTNKASALTEERIREMPISSDILDNMIHDLGIIDCILVGQTMRAMAAQRNDESSAHLLRESDRLIKERENAWRYKPAQPASRRGTRPSKPPKPKRPRGSSPA